MNTKVKILVIISFLLLVLPADYLVAADIEFNSFEEAEAAAHRRAQEYNAKMKEHMKQLNEKWEKQQSELEKSGATPDIKDITETADGNKSSSNAEQAKMTDAVSSSVNGLKEQMMSNAGANTTGFAGGGAGYQWKVKIKGGKFILSDSYNEADFITGQKKDEPEGEAEGGDKVADAKSAEKKPEKKEPAEPAATDPGTSSSGTPADATASSGTPGSASPGGTGTPGSGSGTPAASPGDSGSPAGTGTPGANPASTATAKVPAKPGVNVAPTKLPPPAVRLTIEHPTTFEEAQFTTNIGGNKVQRRKLKDFKIPEDTRVKIAIELAPDIDPNKVSMVLTDEEGDNLPVKASGMRNYRHMFRVPSDKKYHASVYYQDDKVGGSGKKKLMVVDIPVTKVDFEARALASRKHGGGTDGQTISDKESSTGAYTNGYKHSSFGSSEQVDLSDTYDNPESSSESDGNSSSNAGEGSDRYANANGTQGSSQGGSPGGSQSEYGDGSYQDGASGDSGYSQANSSGNNGGSGSMNSRSGDSDSNVAGSNDGTNSADGAYGGNQQGSGDNPSSDQYAYASPGNNNSRGRSSGSSSSNGSSSGYSSGSYSGSGSYGDNSTSGGGSDANINSEGGNDSENQANNAGARSNNSAGASGNGDSANGLKTDTDDNTLNSAGNNDQEATEDTDAFLVGLSIQAPAVKVYQSFDFIDDKNPVSASVPAKTEMEFGLSFANNVDPDSVKIKISDGDSTVAGSLKQMGDSFTHVLSGSNKNVTVNISGKAGTRSFSYNLSIPVT